MQPLGSTASGWSGQFSSHCTAHLPTRGASTGGCNPAVLGCRQQACNFLVRLQESHALLLPGFDQWIWPAHSQMYFPPMLSHPLQPWGMPALLWPLVTTRDGSQKMSPVGSPPSPACCQLCQARHNFWRPSTGGNVTASPSPSLWLEAGPTITVLSRSPYPLGTDAPVAGSKEGSQCGCLGQAPSETSPSEKGDEAWWPQPARCETGLPKAWDKTELWVNLFIPSLEGTRGSLRPAPAPGWIWRSQMFVLPPPETSSQGMPPPPPLPVSDQPNTLFFSLISPACSKQPFTHTQASYLALLQTKQTFLQPSLALTVFALFISLAAASQTRSMSASLFAEEWSRRTSHLRGCP